MDRDMLLEKLTTLDFMAVDLHLYLNTHPKDKDAIKLYNEVVKEADNIRVKYEREYGPLCSFRSGSPYDGFAWVEDPWPWSSNFNFKFS